MWVSMEDFLGLAPRSDEGLWCSPPRRWNFSLFPMLLDGSIKGMSLWLFPGLSLQHGRLMHPPGDVAMSRSDTTGHHFKVRQQACPWRARGQLSPHSPCS